MHSFADLYASSRVADYIARSPSDYPIVRE
jgi:hypothetical protein